MSAVPLSLTVNGLAVSAFVEPRLLLVHFIRDHLELTGTHVGCDTSQCGACVIHVDGRSIKSCTMLALEAEGATITTIEGLSEDGQHPLQKAFKSEHGLQCGYCTPGMIMAAADILRRLPSPDEETIRQQLEGNICRCTGYQNIVRAIAVAAREMATGNEEVSA